MDLKELIGDKLGGAIGDKVGEIVEKLKKEPDLLKKFTQNPTQTLREVTGIEMSAAQLEGLEKAVKTALETSGIADKLGDLKKLF